MLIEARGRDRKQVAISEHFIIGFVGKMLLNYKEHLFVSLLLVQTAGVIFSKKQLWP